MRLILKYKDDERKMMRIKEIVVPFKSTTLSLEETRLCNKLAKDNLKYNEIMLLWELKEDD